MRSAKIILYIFSILDVCALAQQISSQPPAQRKRVVIAASAVLDGKGRVLRNTRIVIEGSKIVGIDPKAGPVDYDLRGLTVDEALTLIDQRLDDRRGKIEGLRGLRQVDGQAAIVHGREPDRVGWRLGRNARRDQGHHRPRYRALWQIRACVLADQFWQHGFDRCAAVDAAVRVRGHAGIRDGERRARGSQRARAVARAGLIGATGTAPQGNTA